MEVLVYQFDGDEYNCEEFELLIPQSSGYIHFKLSGDGYLDFATVRCIQMHNGWSLYRKKMCDHDARWLRWTCFLRCVDESLERILCINRRLSVNSRRWLRCVVCEGRGSLDDSWRLVN